MAILAAAPFTAMVFVWSYLTDGDPAYTLVQVSVNDLIMLALFAPIVDGFGHRCLRVDGSPSGPVLFSAETNPVEVNPPAVKVMREVGIDIPRHRATHVAEFQGRRLHYVVTVCDHAQASCPTEPRGDVSLHCRLDAPAHAKGSIPERVQVFQ